jgi:hypothetical protein
LRRQRAQQHPRPELLGPVPHALTDRELDDAAAEFG